MIRHQHQLDVDCQICGDAATFTGKKSGTCIASATKLGWSLHGKANQAYCPRCVKAGLNPHTPARRSKQ